MCVGINKQTGAIIGSVERVGCSINHPSIWAEKTDTDNKGYYENPIWPIMFIISQTTSRFKIYYGVSLFFFNICFSSSIAKTRSFPR